MAITVRAAIITIEGIAPEATTAKVATITIERIVPMAITVKVATITIERTAPMAITVKAATITIERTVVAEAISLLESAQTQQWNKKEERQQFELQQKSLYALAFIRRDPMLLESYDANYNVVITYQPRSRQYQAMQRLLDFSNRYRQSVASYISRCDVLKAFSKKKG